MAGSINKVILIGNVGNDPELKSVGSSTVCNFRLATTERWKDKEGKHQERTEWHSIVSWGKLAEICGTYLKKGSRVYVEGRIQTEKTEEGKFYTKVVINDMTMLDKKSESEKKDSTEDIPF